MSENARSKIERVFVNRKTTMTVDQVVTKTGLNVKTVRNNLGSMVREDYTGAVPLGYAGAGSYQNWQYAAPQEA